MMGARMVLLGRDSGRLENTCATLAAGDHEYISLDLCCHDEIEPVISKCVGRGGGFDGFVHAAGIEMTVPLQAMNVGRYKSLFEVNVYSGFELARILAKTAHRNLGDASFIFIASVMGMFGQRGKVGYCASKGAVLAGVRALALELVDKKIRVNCISPAIVETDMVRDMMRVLPEASAQAIRDMHPLGIGDPADVANACVFLLSAASRWITGSNMVIDGGYGAQ